MKHRNLLFVVAVIIILVGFIISVAANGQQTTPTQTHACPVALGFKPSSWAEGVTFEFRKVELFYTQPVFFVPAWCNSILLTQNNTTIHIKKDVNGWRLKIWPAKKLPSGDYILKVGKDQYYIKISPRPRT
jgi:hypothetical protein